MKKFLTAVAVAALLVPVAFAGQRTASGFGVHPRAGARHLLSQLNLTAEQKGQMKVIRQEARQENHPLFSSVRAKAREYRQLRRANDPKAEAVKAELAALKPQVRAARAATRDRILSVLTPEQRAQLKQLRAQHPAH